MIKDNGNVASKPENNETKYPKEPSETWADEALADLADYIEEQGVYIRQ